MDGWMTWHEHRYWSPTHGANVLRIGALGEDGLERHCIVSMDVDGSERRRRRAVALEQMARLVLTAKPGEVVIDLEAVDV